MTKHLLSLTELEAAVEEWQYLNAWYAIQKVVEGRSIDLVKFDFSYCTDQYDPEYVQVSYSGSRLEVSEELRESLHKTVSDHMTLEGYFDVSFDMTTQPKLGYDEIWGSNS